MQKKFFVQCLVCGGWYETTTKSKYCPECKEIYRYDQLKKLAQATRRKPGEEREEINKVLTACAEYNKANGTRLSYGQFVSLIDKKGRF